MGYTAIFGGTFNPFHIGHYEMVKALQNDKAIDEIWIMPTNIPPHKVCEYMAEDSDRIKMCEIISEDFPKAKVSLTEFERKGKSYTFDTVTFLQAKFPQKNFIFVCGGDMFVYFPHWYRYEELMKLLPFYVFKRADTDSYEFETCIKKFENEGMKIVLAKEIIPDISSTEFRKTNLPELLPEKIYEYIKGRGIYNV